MANVNNINNAASVYEQINAQNQKGSAAKTQAQSDSEMFMKLMIAQLQNQDPTSPTDTTDFMQQISSMSTVESINNLNTKVSELSNALMTSQAALQASSMVGQKAFVKTDKAELSSGGQVEGVFSLPASASDVRVSVYNASGAQVDGWSLGALTTGDHNFAWSGGQLPAGNYRVVVQATNAEGKYTPVESYIGHTVNSVTLGQNGIGMKVNTNAGAVGINDIKQLG